MGVPFSRGDFFYFDTFNLYHYGSDWALKATVAFPIDDVSFCIVEGWDHNFYGVGDVSGTSGAADVYKFPKDGSAPVTVTTIALNTPRGHPVITRDTVSGTGYYIAYTEELDPSHVNDSDHIVQVDNAFAILSDTTYLRTSPPGGSGLYGLALLSTNTPIYTVEQFVGNQFPGSTASLCLTSAGAVLVNLTLLDLDDFNAPQAPTNSLTVLSDDTMLFMCAGITLGSVSYSKVARISTSGQVWATTIATTVPGNVHRMTGNPILDIDGTSCWVIETITTGGLVASANAVRVALSDGTILSRQTLAVTTFPTLDRFSLSRFFATYKGDHIESSGGVEIGDLPEQLQVVFIDADNSDLYQLGDGHVVSAHPPPGLSHWHVITTDGSTPLYVIVGSTVYPIIAGVTSIVALSAARTPVTVVTTLGIYETVLIVPALAAWRLQRFDSKVRMEERA